jgi:hypothetical protein
MWNGQPMGMMQQPQMMMPMVPMPPAMVVPMQPMVAITSTHEQVSLYMDSIAGTLERLVLDWSGCEMLLHHLRGEHYELVVGRVLEELSSADVLADVMCDDTGVQLSLGLIGRCTTQQRLTILKAIGPCIFRISSSTNGAWAMQALINNLDSNEEVERLQRALKGRVAAMMMGTAASQVLIACGSRMRFLGANNFIFREIAQGINSIVQSQPAVTCFSSLIAVASPSQASDLADSISTYVLRMAQHKLGNYVVQMVLDRAYSEHMDEDVKSNEVKDNKGANKMLRAIGTDNQLKRITRARAQSIAPHHSASCVLLTRKLLLFMLCVSGACGTV